MGWYALGLELGAKDYTLNVIEHNHKGDPEMCCREMLLNWLIGKRDCGDCPRTWDDLLQVVQGVVGSEASAFIKKEVFNWEEEHMEQSPAEREPDHLILICPCPLCSSCVWDLCMCTLCLCVQERHTGDLTTNTPLGLYLPGGGLQGGTRYTTPQLEADVVRN